MKDRITQFMANEGITPAEFADKIGVQRSSVSHVLNGRNYPSASFIQKMLGSYKNLNSRWLLLGEGSMFENKISQVKEPSLFHFPNENETQKTESIPLSDIPVKESIIQPSENPINKPLAPINMNQPEVLTTVQSVSELIDSSLANKEVERIVLFYKDKTFAAYTPSK